MERRGKATVFAATHGDQELLVLVVAAGTAPASLGAAEREVLALIRAGLSNAAIARARRRSVRTVANQVSSILRKLGATSRAALTAG